MFKVLTVNLRILLLKVREADHLGSHIHSELAANADVELEYEQQDTGSIVQGLGYLPLALDQAGAYIYMQQYSFSRYLREYKTNGSYLLGGSTET